MEEQLHKPRIAVPRMAGSLADPLEDPIEKARHTIASNQYMTLSTCKGRVPWAAPLWYAVDEDYNFYFLSARDSLHTWHIKYNPKVAIAIFNSTEPPEIVDGVQIAGLAGLVDDEDLPRVCDFFFRKRFPDENERAKHRTTPEHFRGNSIRVFFQIVPTEIYKVDLSITEVDRRLQIRLSDLRRRPTN